VHLDPGPLPPFLGAARVRKQALKRVGFAALRRTPNPKICVHLHGKPRKFPAAYINLPPRPALNSPHPIRTRAPSHPVNPVHPVQKIPSQPPSAPPRLCGISPFGCGSAALRESAVKKEPRPSRPAAAFPGNLGVSQQIATRYNDALMHFSVIGPVGSATHRNPSPPEPTHGSAADTRPRIMRGMNRGHR